jgi:putative radical SAM enzyme (TIGR03279 family)
MSHPTVLEVVPGSPANAAGLEVGDEVVAVNGVVPTDVIEYQQLIDDPDPQLTVLRAGEKTTIHLDKAAGELVGLRLNASIFDRVQTCDNHCEFCFIYQLPPGMRKTLYLKDDDYRLSFLYGNFTTLTRFTELDLARVVEEKLGPLYVSIHATDPEVRSRMLRNPRGGTSLRWLRGLLDNDVTVHGQVVLCPGINNGAVFERTAAEILARYPKLASVGIVPLGLSRYNTEEHLYPHSQQEAADDLDAVHFWQDRALEMLGRRMFFASDELYMRGEVPVPESDAYEGFAQHENGIGMVRAFYDELAALDAGNPEAPPVVSGEWRTIPSAPDEFYRARKHSGNDPHGEAGPVAILTGRYGEMALRPVLGDLERLAGRPLRLLTVRNEFFGGNTGVAGLLTGSDVTRTVTEDTESAGRYLLPDVALSGDTFLDDVTLDEVRQATPVPLIVAATTAGGLLEGALR